MTVNLSDKLAKALDRLAKDQGREVGLVVEEAIRDYLVATSITDVSSHELAVTQAALMPELGHVDGYGGNGSVDDHATN